MYPSFLFVELVIVFFILSRLVYNRWISTRPVKRLPPGPRAIPVLGNVHQLPSEHQERTFAEWGRKYGDVSFAQLFRTPVLVINSLRAAQDLLEKKSSKYSFRPGFILMVEMMGWDCVVTHMTYGERFRKHRRWISQAFQDKTALSSYLPLQRRETYMLLSGLMESPDLFRSHIRRFAAAMIMQITYGHSVTSLNDKYIRLAEQAGTKTVESGSAGSMLVDFFPVLRHVPTWLPGAGFKRRALECREAVQEMLDTPFAMVKDAMLSGTANPCFTASLLEEVQGERVPTRDDEKDIKGAAGVLYGAATDTTVSVLSTFILAMVLHPTVYQKAQEEMDRVTGGERLPDFQDRDSLPYLENVLKEVFRWNCPVPLGIPHKVMLDDDYRGFHIPGGSMVIANIWAMTQNKEVYPEPKIFHPERYEQMDRETAAAEDPRNMVFGFGRRVCPGQEFADTSVWMAAANIIATLDIGLARDAAGAKVVPAASFTSGFVSHPREFACSISPRCEKARTIVSMMHESVTI